MTQAQSACVLVAGDAGAGSSPLAQWLAGLGFHSPSLGQSSDALRINRDFLTTLGLRWWDPEPLPDDCFSTSAAVTAQAEIGALLDQFVDAGGDALLQDASLARLGPLWLEELKARFEPVVIVRVLSRADAAFQALSVGAWGDADSPSMADRAPLRFAVAALQSGAWALDTRRAVAAGGM